MGLAVKKIEKLPFDANKKNVEDILQRLDDQTLEIEKQLTMKIDWEISQCLQYKITDTESIINNMSEKIS